MFDDMGGTPMVGATVTVYKARKQLRNRFNRDFFSLIKIRIEVI